MGTQARKDKMENLAKRSTAFAAVQLAALLAISASAAVPDAEWDGDFLDVSKGSFVFDAQGNTVAADGSSVTIGSSADSLGAAVRWTANLSRVTIIVKYSNLSPSVDYGALALFNKRSESNHVGILVNQNGNVQGAWMNSAYSTETTGLGAGSGRFALRYSAPAGEDVRGVTLWDKTSEGWSEIYRKSGLAAGGDSDLSDCTIGGPVETSAVIKAIPGMKIEAVAVFGSALGVEDVASYQFPSERENEYETNPTAGATCSWAGLPWKRGAVPAFDDSSAKVTIKLSGDLALTNAPVSLRAESLAVTGTGRFILPVGFDLSQVVTKNFGSGVVLCYDGNSPTLDPPVPEVEWERDFLVTSKNEYTLSANGNTVAADGTSITIGSGNSIGATIGWSSDWGAATVIIRYSDMPSTSSSGILTMFGYDSTDVTRANFVGISEQSSGDMKAAWTDGFWGSTFARPNAAGHFALRFSDKNVTRPQGVNWGTFAWKGESGIWSQIFGAEGLVAGYCGFRKCSVGGPVATSSNHGVMSGMAIEAIALFRGALTDAQVAAYHFPSERHEYETESVSAGTYTWAGLPWKRMLVPSADDTAAKVTINLSGDVVLTGASQFDFASLTVTGTGRLTFATGTAFGSGLAGTVASGASIAGASGTLALGGTWEIHGAAEGNVRVDLPASVAVYGGSLGSGFSGSGTVRFVETMPGETACGILQNGNVWTGNCVLENITANQANINLNLYGNSLSKLTLKGVKAYFPRSSDGWINPEVVLEDLPSRYALDIYNGFGITVAARFNKLSGSGTLMESDYLTARLMFLTRDSSGFTGSILASRIVMFCFGPDDYLPGGSQPAGVVYVPSGCSLDLAPRSVFSGRLNELDGTTGYVYIGGSLTVTSRKSVLGDVKLDGGTLTFDADKAGDVAEASLTDCSDCDFSGIALKSTSATGMVWFTGSYSPFVMPDDPAKGLAGGFAVRIDAAMQGDISITSEFGGRGTLESGTLTLGEGAALNRTWGVLSVAEGAAMTASCETLRVVADPVETGVEDFLLFEGGGDFSGLSGIALKVVSPDGARIGTYGLEVSPEGVIAKRQHRGTKLIIR